MASNQNSFEVKSPSEFTVSIVYDKTTRKISCDTDEKKEWKNPCDIYTSFNFLKFTFFLLLFLSICRGLVVLNAKKKYKNSSNFLNFVWSQLCFENVLKQQILRLIKKYVNGISDVKSIQMFHVENKDILSRGFLNMKEQTLLK